MLTFSVTLLVLSVVPSAGLAFQAPPTVRTSDGFGTSSPNRALPAHQAVTPALRGGTMMARKMAREAIDPEIFEQHSSQGVMVQERTIEERAGYFYILAKTCAKAGQTERTLQYSRKALENGFKDRDKFKAEPEFSTLQENLEFQQILAAEYKVL